MNTTMMEHLREEMAMGEVKPYQAALFVGMALRDAQLLIHTDPRKAAELARFAADMLEASLQTEPRI